MVNHFSKSWVLGIITYKHLCIRRYSICVKMPANFHEDFKSHFQLMEICRTELKCENLKLADSPIPKGSLPKKSSLPVKCCI